jgi:lysozyme
MAVPQSQDDVFDRLVKPAEGLRLQVYDDKTGSPVVPGYTMQGHPTIGIGRALDVKGISMDENDMLYENDKCTALTGIIQDIPWAITVDDVRYHLLGAMAFQMGINGLKEFTRMLAAVQGQHWQIAHDEMLDSAWARETPARARQYANIMLTGEMP